MEIVSKQTKPEHQQKTSTHQGQSAEMGSDMPHTVYTLLSAGLFVHAAQFRTPPRLTMAASLYFPVSHLEQERGRPALSRSEPAPHSTHVLPVRLVPSHVLSGAYPALQALLVFDPAQSVQTRTAPAQLIH